MFKRIGLKREVFLRKNGSIKLRIVPAPHLFSNMVFTDVKHAIIFTPESGENYASTLFSCKVTKVANALILTELEFVEDCLYASSESSRHFFLGWVIEEIQKWAGGLGKTIAIVETKESHASEWLVEHGFTLRVLHRPEIGQYYHGRKNLTGETLSHENN